MSDFQDFKQTMQNHFAKMINGATHLFMADVDKETMWELYLASFPPGTNEIYRERREYDCACCRHFIKSMGAVVAIIDNAPVTIWDLPLTDEKFSVVAAALAEFVRGAPIQDVYVTKEQQHGTDKNWELLSSGAVHTWHHFNLYLPPALVHNSNRSVNEQMAAYRDTKAVFVRSLEEISPEAFETVLDLIAEKTLYRGEEWQAQLEKLRDLQNQYLALLPERRDYFAWDQSTKLGGAVARIRNHSIGVLLQDITNGVDLLEAVKKYERIMAPENYQRPKAIFTRKMVAQAQAAIKELGLENALMRRHAHLEDVTINNVLWANRNAKKRMNGLEAIFDELAKEANEKPSKYENVPGVSVDEFLNEIMPQANSIEVLFENSQIANLVSLIAPQDMDAPSLTKWANPFTWTYNGNLADSSMKSLVKSFGGKVDGVLRFSFRWNEHGDCNDDLDAHCHEPNGNEICYYNMRSGTSGHLDVDIINPQRQCGGKVAVENIIYTRLDQMPNSEYGYFIECYNKDGGRSGFDAEIEFSGNLYQYHYDQALFRKERIRVATVTKSASGFSIVHHLPHSESNQTVWGLGTNQFHEVSTIMYSPNYWDNQQGIGNLHVLFMLPSAINPDEPRGFVNEHLRSDLSQRHRQVFEVLGAKMKVAQSDNQLSGLGFSSTKRTNLIVRVDGKIQKIVF